MSHVFTLPTEQKYKIYHSVNYIAGIEVYGSYSSLKPSPFTHKQEGLSYKLLFLTHGRCQNAEMSKVLAESILDNYYKSEKKGLEPLIIFSFDNRNHGKRVIDKQRNLDWSEGNEYHAIDMLSLIDGMVYELKNIVDYIPSYWPHLLSCNLTKIVSGVSMGGHATIRAISRYPGLFDAAIPIVGCFDLSSLMLNRLHDFKKGNLFESSYEQIVNELNEQDQERYPRALFNKISKDDTNVLLNYDINKLRTLALFGEDDNIVVLEYSADFLSKLGQSIKSRDELELISSFQAIKYPTKHHVTDEMIQDIASWLVAYESFDDL